MSLRADPRSNPDEADPLIHSHHGRPLVVDDRPGVTPLYRAIVLEIERRRIQLNISQDEVSDRAGVADRLYSKSLFPDTPSGRQSNWRTLQDIVDALFPEGFDVEIRPKKGRRLSARDLRCKIRFASAPKDPRSHRELMRDLGLLGAKARMSKLSKRELKKIARTASKVAALKRSKAAAARAQTQSEPAT
jgi:hypothetical protein